MNLKLRNSGIFILMAILLVSSVFAVQSFTVSTEAVDNRIFSDEVAEFTFTIQNLDIENDQYTIYTTDPSWNVDYEKSVVTLGEKETREVGVIIDPTSQVADGQIYTVPVYVKSLEDDEVLETLVTITLDSESIRTYQPSIFVDVIIGDHNVVDPLQTVPVSVRFINKNSLNMESLTVSLQSDLINDVYTIPLGPKEEVTKVLSYALSPQTIPGEKSLDIVLSIDGEQVSVPSRFMYEVAQSRPEFERVVLVDSDANEKLFLKSTYEVELKNNGNIAQSETLAYPLSWIAGFFTDATEPTAYKKMGGKRHAVYDISLEPGESTTISITTSYQTFTTILVLLILIVGGSIACYYFFRAPIVIKKRVVVLGEVGDGVSRLKVILDIKNRTGKLLKNIQVRERAPTITEVDDDFSVGTLAPTKVIKNAVKGTLVRWDFHTIEPYEERLITYTIRSKLSILGELKLPSSIVTYERFGQKQTVTEAVDETENDEIDEV